jgi:hypothetical protein
MGTQFTRFFFPGMAVMTIMAAGETYRLISGRANIVLKCVVAAAVIYLVAYSYPVKNFDKITGLNSFLGIDQREDFLKGSIDYYSLYKRVNADPSVNERIMLFGEIRGYYLKKDYVWGDQVNQAIISYNNTRQTLNDMKNDGIKYVIYCARHKGDMNEELKIRTWRIMDDILAHNAELLYCENSVCLYRLK